MTKRRRLGESWHPSRLATIEPANRRLQITLLAFVRDGVVIAHLTVTGVYWQAVFTPITVIILPDH